MVDLSQSSGSPEALQESAMAGGRPSRVGVSCCLRPAHTGFTAAVSSVHLALPFQSVPHITLPRTLRLHSSFAQTLPGHLPSANSRQHLVWLLVSSLFTETLGSATPPVPRSSLLTWAQSGLGSWKLPCKGGLTLLTGFSVLGVFLRAPMERSEFKVSLLRLPASQVWGKSSTASGLAGCGWVGRGVDGPWT